jgi:hypothetical protein
MTTAKLQRMRGTKVTSKSVTLTAGKIDAIILAEFVSQRTGKGCMQYAVYSRSDVHNSYYIERQVVGYSAHTMRHSILYTPIGNILLGEIARTSPSLTELVA